MPCGQPHQCQIGKAAVAIHGNQTNSHLHLQCKRDPRTALWQGHYYDNNFTAAKQDFATRSGLIPSSLLFTPEQLAEVYRSIHETLDSSYTITGGAAAICRMYVIVSAAVDRT